MGFLLFTESSVFNPINYGLQAGDNVFVVAVGGGGGAGGVQFNSSNPYNNYQPLAGGAGAPSSFGEYVTAPGGQGNTGSVAQNDTYRIGGGYGLGGWFPWLESHPISDASPSLSAWVPQQYLNRALAHVTTGLRGYNYFGGNAAQNIYVPQLQYVSQQSTSGFTLATVTNIVKDPEEVSWATFYIGLVSNQPCITTRILSKEIPAAGQGMARYQGQQGITYGSIGYGVGGTGLVWPYSSYFPYANSGTTGSIIKKMIMLEDTSPIAVSVGGGGGGAGFKAVSGTPSSGAKNGNNGSTSAQAPSNGNQYSGAGGYAGVNPADNGGGGVCGCVAIWF